MQLPIVIRPASYLALFFIMVLFEWLAPYVGTEQRKSHRVGFHLGVSLFNTVLLYLIMAWPTYNVLLFAQNHKIGLTHLLGLSGMTEIFATVIALDFWDYWMHLANHRIGFLWRFHKAHHSDMEMDVTTASRFHIGELIISGGIKCAAILVWGPSLAGLIIFDTLLTGSSEFHHSNVSIPLKVQDWLEAIMVTPRMHRCHHSLHRNCFNHNYATIFSPWDRLFGSYHWAKFAPELQPIGLYRPRGAETMKIKQFLATPLTNNYLN